MECLFITNIITYFDVSLKSFEIIKYIFKTRSMMIISQTTLINVRSSGEKTSNLLTHFPKKPLYNNLVFKIMRY